MCSNNISDLLQLDICHASMMLFRKYLRMIVEKLERHDLRQTITELGNLVKVLFFGS